MIGDHYLDKLSREPVLLRGEPFWDYQDSLRIVDELSAMGAAIVGVELYVREGDCPKWIESSQYEVENGLSWDACVEQCKRHAQEFLLNNQGYREGLFNFALLQETDGKKGP